MNAVNEGGLEWLSAVEAAAAIREGRLTSRDYTEACLDAIARQEDTVGAWTFLDRDYALAQADAADEAHRLGRPHGPLHGLPIGVKDIFDTRDMPTEDGSPLHAGRTPRDDAAAVARLRAAGGLVMGKTVTTEFATYHPGKTANPHDPRRTPGGSSSGSAAAVACGMVPLAIGSQTNGSTIRPASFCGVVGYKPSFGAIPRNGALKLSRALDHVGLFARDVPDVALLAECLFGCDAEDPDTRPQAVPPLLRAALSEPPTAPRLAFVPGPVWELAESETQEAFGELIEALNEADAAPGLGKIEQFDLSEGFSEAQALHAVVMETDLACNLAREYRDGADRISPVLRAMIERGLNQHGAYDYARALAMMPALNEALEEAFFNFDAFITPAAAGPAPFGLEATGSPAFCSLWTFCGLPAITLPLLRSADGMPLGVQLIGQRGADAKLLRTAQWLMTRDFT